MCKTMVKNLEIYIVILVTFDCSVRSFVQMSYGNLQTK